MQKAAARVLLVFGSRPGGHAAAAFALEEALRGEGFITSVVEVAADHHPWAGRAIARAYHGAVRWAPSLWGILHRSGTARNVLRLSRRAYFAAGGGRRIRRRIARENPDVVVSTQAAISAMLCEARRRSELLVPVVSVVTDFSTDTFLTDPLPDHAIVPNKTAAAELTSRGLSRDRVHVCGIPIHAAYRRPLGRREARRMLGLPSSSPVALVSGGSRGLGGIDETAAAVLEDCPRAVVLALCGTDDSLRRNLSRRSEHGARLRVYGPQSPELVAALMAASDAHLGKPGGVTAAESLAMGLPMIFPNAVPGQEERNARYLVERGAALWADGPRAAASTFLMSTSDRVRLDNFRRAAADAGRPLSAIAAAAAIGRCLTPEAQTGKITACPPK